MITKSRIDTRTNSLSHSVFAFSQNGTKINSYEGYESKFPANILELLLQYLLLDTRKASSTFDPDTHFCSLDHPCQAAWLCAWFPVLSLRLVSSSWNIAVLAAFRASSHHDGIDNFFKQVEYAYYPHTWHINTKVRKHIVLGRFRIFRTISSEDGDRGVYLAYDFGTSNLGCLNADVVIIKAWLTPDDRECVTEKAVYQVFHDGPAPGVPKVIISAQDRRSGVYAIALQRLGPTLEDIIQVFPGKRLNEKMVLAVAVQLLECYKHIHFRGVIHNGVKPANICLPPSQVSGLSPKVASNLNYHLYAIDFGLGSLLKTHESLPDGYKADTTGNRHFLSIFGHHGVTLSQRDDLESLAYLLSFLAHGVLPWTTPPPRKVIPRLAQPQLWRIKMSTPASILFRDMDRSFIEFWKDVKGLAFGETPDYDNMAQRFKACWERKNYGGRPGDVDWATVAHKAHARENPIPIV